MLHRLYIVAFTKNSPRLVMVGLKLEHFPLKYREFCISLSTRGVLTNHIDITKLGCNCLVALQIHT